MDVGEGKGGSHISYGYSEGGIFPCDSVYNDDGLYVLCQRIYLGIRGQQGLYLGVTQDQGNDLKLCENL